MLVSLAVSALACGSTPPAPTPALNLSGTWSGVVGAGSGGGNALRVAWAASQGGTNVTGAATLSTSPALTNVTFSGTLSGTLTGSQLSLDFTSPPGSVPAFGGCAASGKGSAIVADGTMSGNLTVNFTACDGLGLQPPASSQLTFTRQ